MSDSPEVVVAGHICLDMIPAFAGREMSLPELLTPGKLVDVGPLTTATGGPVSNTGLALAKLGFKTGLMGKVGDDVVGRAILDIIRAYGPGLDEGMIVTSDASSSYTIVISPPGVDRIFLHCPGANDAFGADDVAYERLAAARMFHFGYPPLMRRMYADGGAELSDLLSRARRPGVTVSLDMARPDPASDAGRADWRAILSRALPHVDVFLPSFDETLFMLDRPRFDAMLAGGEDLNAQADPDLLHRLAAELLAMGAAIVGLKLGTQGFYLLTTREVRRLAAAGRCAPRQPSAWAGQELLAPCFAVEVMGTTGSGDCTIAGFLGALLKGLSAEDAMTAAVAAGACSVERADAVSGLPDWSVVQQRIAAGWPRRETSLHLKGWRYDPAQQVWRRA